MIETPDLAARIRRLEDRAELRELAALYGITIDNHDLRAVAELFTPDASFGSKDGVMGATGREAIVEQFRGRFRALGPGSHFVHDQVLYFDDADPDRASGLVTSHAEVWRNGQAMIASMRYHDDYRRFEGKWRFQTRLLAFFYYLPVEEYMTGLGDKLRMRAYGDRRPADFPKRYLLGTLGKKNFDDGVRAEGSLAAIGMTQAERVRDALEHDIVRGLLLPGMRLEDDEIAQRFGVSRTPVREAILQLVETGLVTKQPRQGAAVAYLDVTQMIQMFELTSELSGLCGKFATRRMSAADKKRMRDINANLEKAVKADSVEDYTLHNRRFHDWIIRQSRNDFLIEAINRMSRRLMAYFNYHLTYPGQIERDFHDHCTLISAIETNDAELAQQLLRRHAMIQGDIFAEFVSMSHRGGRETGLSEFMETIS